MRRGPPALIGNPKGVKINTPTPSKEQPHTSSSSSSSNSSSDDGEVNTTVDVHRPDSSALPESGTAAFMEPFNSQRPTRPQLPGIRKKKESREHRESFMGGGATHPLGLAQYIPHILETPQGLVCALRDLRALGDDLRQVEG